MTKARKQRAHQAGIATLPQKPPPLDVLKALGLEGAIGIPADFNYAALAAKVFKGKELPENVAKTFGGQEGVNQALRAAKAARRAKIAREKELERQSRPVPTITHEGSLTGRGKFTAWLGLQEVGSLEHTRNHVDYIHTYPEYEGQGIATAMMDELRKTHPVVNFGTVTRQGNKFKQAYVRAHKGSSAGSREVVGDDYVES
jgi:hypothetical protein